MNYDYDVAIIGAGPIGSSLAYQLASSNVKVALIDKKKKVGLPLQCAHGHGHRHAQKAHGGV